MNIFNVFINQYISIIILIEYNYIIHNFSNIINIVLFYNDVGYFWDETKNTSNIVDIA